MRVDAELDKFINIINTYGVYYKEIPEEYLSEISDFFWSKNINIDEVVQGYHLYVVPEEKNFSEIRGLFNPVQKGVAITNGSKLLSTLVHELTHVWQYKVKGRQEKKFKWIEKYFPLIHYNFLNENEREAFTFQRQFQKFKKERG